MLSDPDKEVYHVESSSQKGKHYVLEMVGPDITCNCTGFEYRGVCTHYRTLKDALVGEKELPEGCRRVDWT